MTYSFASRPLRDQLRATIELIQQKLTENAQVVVATESAFRAQAICRQLDAAGIEYCNATDAQNGVSEQLAQKSRVLLVFPAQIALAGSGAHVIALDCECGGAGTRVVCQRLQQAEVLHSETMQAPERAGIERTLAQSQGIVQSSEQSDKQTGEQPTCSSNHTAKQIAPKQHKSAVFLLALAVVAVVAVVAFVVARK